MKQRAENRRVAAAAHIDGGNAALDEGRVDGFGTHTIVFVDLGPPAHGAHRRVGVGERVMAARRIEQVQIEIFTQVLPQAHTLVVEFHTFGREVIRADDGGVTPGIAAADISLFQHRHVADAVVAGQIVRGRQSMTARADDDHVITRFQRVMAREHAGFRMFAR